MVDSDQVSGPSPPEAASVPVVFAAEHLEPESHTMLFVLSVLAIVPLAALLSHATESVAAKTGDGVGGLLNATLGNLTTVSSNLARNGLFWKPRRVQPLTNTTGYPGRGPFR